MGPMRSEKMPTDTAQSLQAPENRHKEDTQERKYVDGHTERVDDSETKSWSNAKQKRDANDVKDGEERETIEELRMKKKQKLREMKEKARLMSKRVNENTRTANTSVYVSNLPLDITIEELESVFSKYGVLAEDINTNEKRVKIYKDENGNSKGDALIVYHRAESVQLAVDLLDDTEIRPGVKVHVEKATYNSSSNGNSNSTDNDSSVEVPKKPVVLDEDRKRKIDKVQKKLQSKLNDWEEDKGTIADIKSRLNNKKYERIVVIKHCFTQQEISEDPEVLEDVEEDMMKECSKFGEISKIVIYDLEPEGIVTIKFATKDAAEQCIIKINGRFFAGQQLEVFKYSGESFKKSQRDEEKEEERLRRYEEKLLKG